MFGAPHRHAGVWHAWRSEVAEEAEQGPQGTRSRGQKQARGRVYTKNEEQEPEVKQLIRRPWRQPNGEVMALGIGKEAGLKRYLESSRVME